MSGVSPTARLMDRPWKELRVSRRRAAGERLAVRLPRPGNAVRLKRRENPGAAVVGDEVGPGADPPEWCGFRSAITIFLRKVKFFLINIRKYGAIRQHAQVKTTVPAEQNRKET